MASKVVEDIHVSLLEKLLEESGIECTRSPQLSIEYESYEGVIEEQETEVEDKTAAPDEVVQEEKEIEGEPEFEEEEPAVFPSPSLRKVLPERIREFESQNRIHVLPSEFKTEIDPPAIPKIASTGQQKCIDLLGDMVGCTSYKTSMAEFWFLDTLANLLRRAQKDELNRAAQAALILWFCEWMKEIQNFDAADRQRMLKRFQDNMVAAAKLVAEEERLPTPAQAGVHYQSFEQPIEGNMTEAVTSSPLASIKPPLAVTFTKDAYACSLRELTMIFHYIYDLFSTDYQFDLVRSVFTFTPDFILIDMPYQIQHPKTLLTPLKPLKREKPQKKEKQKGKKSHPDTAEYTALMELKEKEHHELEARDEHDRQDYHIRSHILPLNLAATEELFDKYWPPPPPSEPEPEPEPEPKSQRGKKK